MLIRQRKDACQGCKYTIKAVSLQTTLSPRVRDFNLPEGKEHSLDNDQSQYSISKIKYGELPMASVIVLCNFSNNLFFILT